MDDVFAFRLCILAMSILAAWKWGDWKNWRTYYPTVIFVMLVNMSAAFLTYHHGLWVFGKDAFVKTQSTVELLNTYVILPATTFAYLSRFPVSGLSSKIMYVCLWIAGFAVAEYIDSHFIGGILYDSGWRWSYSAVFDIIMFAIIYIHYHKPLYGWLITLGVAMFILWAFGFFSAEYK